MNIRNSSLLVLTLILAGLLKLTPAALAADYLTSHSALDKNWRLDFPASVSGEMFLASGMALEILEVNCDGKPVPPAEKTGHVQRDLTHFSEPVGNVIYSCEPELFWISVWENGKLVWEKTRDYTIPRDAKVITVRYRIHTADGKVSSENTVTSIEMNFARRHRDANGAIKLSEVGAGGESQVMGLGVRSSENR